MTANQYDGNPATSDIMWIRDKIGDVDNDAIILLDAEITAEITNHSNLYIAASECAYKCISRLGEYKELAALFKQRGDLLKQEAKRGRFTTVSTVSAVRDSQTYPDKFISGDETPTEWNIEPNTSGDYV